MVHVLNNYLATLTCSSIILPLFFGNKVSILYPPFPILWCSWLGCPDSPSIQTYVTIYMYSVYICMYANIYLYIYIYIHICIQSNTYKIYI